MSKKRNSITMTEVEHNNAYDNMIYTIENDDQPQPPPPHLLGRRRSHAFSFSENENDKPNDDPINKILTEQDVNGDVESNPKNQSDELLAVRSIKVYQPKDFTSEIRCKRDIELFVSSINPCIWLDASEIHLISLINKLLRKVIQLLF